VEVCEFDSLKGEFSSDSAEFLFDRNRNGSAPETVGELSCLVAEEALQSHHVVRHRVHDDVGKQRQGGDDLGASDQATGKADLTRNEEVLVHLDDYDIGAGEEHRGRAPRSVVDPCRGKEDEPIVLS
jgi:hypothetical protein